MSETIRFKELRTKVFPHQPYWISDGLLNHQSVMVIGGGPKSYKSYLVNTFIYHLTTATPLFSMFNSSKVWFNIPKQAKVLYLEQEIGGEDLKQRLNTLAEGLSPDQAESMEANLYTRSMDDAMALDSLGGRSHLANIIAPIQPDVVILDPLIKFHRGDENSSRDMANILRNLQWLRIRFGFATIIVHHTGKPTEFTSMRQGPERLRGSSVLHGDADTFVMVNCLRTLPAVLKLSFTLRRGKPLPDLKIIEEPTGRFGFSSWESEHKASVAEGGVAKVN